MLLDTSFAAADDDPADTISEEDTMPMDRLRMRPWLEEQIDSCEIPGLKWVNKEERIFQIPWLHGSHQHWDLEKDTLLFMRWAIHTGKYRPGEERPNPRVWKSNFRCALNSLPDIVEVKNKTIKRGSNAFRVYKMLSFDRHINKAMRRKIKKMMAIKGVKVDDGSSIDYTKPHLSQVKEVSSEETDSAEEFGIKDEPDEIHIKEEAGFIKSEEEDFPCTIVTVRIGENGEVEETDVPTFSLALDPQRHLKKSGQNVNSLETDCLDDLNMNSESPVNQMPIKPKKHRLVQGPHKYELEDLDQTKTGETSFRFQDGETSGEGSSLMPAMS
ncbi:uncharacterized protein LOC117377657 isoform X1 [Periophthalmus magnuspinnatus]|uniref:uncharacterized protein LOC117377657 isoform X1 n=2 Tax=Periophthalmus magnuspinnatus TaxID=409849 RepID=UPI0024371C25|nr:uncharacterized protein LOC117377657 isoform X1 [Periophthalmus magnuspinnatus]XP_055080717.1 uncharacterized protein LOC117377657 isoform X1 [Periophthalmus magnuspinnatus]